MTDPRLFPGLLSTVAPGFTTAAVGEQGLGLLKEHFFRPLRPRAFGRQAMQKASGVSQTLTEVALSALRSVGFALADFFRVTR